MIFGMAIALGGLLLALAPLRAARAANALRFVPYSVDPNRVKGYRVAGWLIVAVGVVAALAL